MESLNDYTEASPSPTCGGHKCCPGRTFDKSNTECVDCAFDTCGEGKTLYEAVCDLTKRFVEGGDVLLFVKNEHTNETLRIRSITSKHGEIFLNCR